MNRKLAVLAWHLLTHNSEYRWTPPSLTAHKHRQVQLKAGAPHQRGRSIVGIRTQQTSDQEREPLRQAEEAYRTMVAARRAKGAREKT